MPSRSTPIAARESAACAASWSTAWRTGPTAGRRSASSICVASRTATRSPSSRGARRRSRWSRIWSWIAAPSTAIIAAGGYVSVNCGGAPGRQQHPDSQGHCRDAAMDSAACIGCGACVAACKNASAHLFMSAKISHLALLPQGQPERRRRVVSMIEAGGRRRIRQLLERRRMRGGLPEGDSDLEHRPDDAGICQGGDWGL